MQWLNKDMKYQQQVEQRFPYIDITYGKSLKKKYSIVLYLNKLK